MMPPIDAFLVWFEGLPHQHKVDIAALVASSSPGFSGLDAWQPGDLPGAFVSLLQSLRLHRYQEVGLALALRSSIEFFFVNERSTHQGWRKRSGQYEIAWPEDYVERWIETCFKWHSLRRGSLSDAALTEFLNIAQSKIGGKNTDGDD